MAAFGGAFDDFGRHVHGGAVHGFLLLRGDREVGVLGKGEAVPGSGLVVLIGGRRGLVGRGARGLEGLALAGDHLSGAKIDVFDYAVVVEEDV